MGGRADVRDVCKRPVLYKGNDETANEGSNSLTHENGAWGDFHIMAKLQIAGETDGLSRSREGNALEDHVRDGPSWKHIPGKHFVHDLERDLLVGYGLNHANGEREKTSETERYEEAPDRQLGWENLDGDDHEDDSDKAQTRVPKLRYFRVCSHETRVNVCFVVKGVRKSADDVMAIPKECVDNHGCEGGEAETVSNALCR